jgi:ribonuclease HI
VIFTDGSRIPKRTTAAAAWCKNTKQSLSAHLGPARTHGIFQGEYRGVQMGLILALRTASPHTRRATILLDNQGVIMDLRSNKLPITNLDDRKNTYKQMNYLHQAFPNLRITIRWCPGHSGVQGNEIVDKIANKKAKTKLPSTFRVSPNASSFITAIKEWRTRNATTITPDEKKRLGHEPQSSRHLKSISRLNKHEIAAITQLRSGHVHLNQYLHKFKQQGNPSCECQEGIESVEHFLLTCHRYDNERKELEKALKPLNLLPLKTSILNNPSAFEAIAKYCNNTWRLKSRWIWARITNEAMPEDRQQPEELHFS